MPLSEEVACLRAVSHLGPQLSWTLGGAHGLGKAREGTGGPQPSRAPPPRLSCSGLGHVGPLGAGEAGLWEVEVWLEFPHV